MIKVSNCCGKHGFIEVFDGRLSGTNLQDSEKAGKCPECLKPCSYVSPAQHQKLMELEQEKYEWEENERFARQASGYIGDTGERLIDFQR
jgi:hypothetical protein